MDYVVLKHRIDTFFITNADPENKVYDKLALNRGWDTMIRPATAFRFRDRIFGNGQSLDQLFEVLGKWKDGTPQCPMKHIFVKVKY